MSRASIITFMVIGILGMIAYIAFAFAMVMYALSAITGGATGDMNWTMQN